MRYLYLTKQETQLLYEEIYKDKSKHRKRNIALFEIAKYCALRVSEIKHLQMSHYDKENATLFCQREKGSNSNTLKIVSHKVLSALNDYLEERESYSTKGKYMFISQKGNPISRQRMDAIIKSYCRHALCIHPEKWHMHVLRHTRAIELIEYGFDVDDVKFWLGHKNVNNTLKYLSYTTVLHKQLFHTLMLLEGEAEPEK